MLWSIHDASPITQYALGQQVLKSGWYSKHVALIINIQYRHGPQPLSSKLHQWWKWKPEEP